MNYAPRSCSAQLRELLGAFPVIYVVGPRQCGKSTLIRHELKDWTILDLEFPTDFHVLHSDPVGFFDKNLRHVAIDEAQRMPDLFPILRSVIDRNRANGRFILSGSATPSLIRNISESLAGRVAMLELTPFRAAELKKSQLNDRWFLGGFPSVHEAVDDRRRILWFENYISTLIERDMPALGLRLAPQRLRSLLMMLTHVHGDLLNVSDLARSLGISASTVNHYLDILEGTFMIRRLYPHFTNIQKRLVKSPKLYIRDTGLLHFLAGLRDSRELETWNRRGQSFEGLVVEEILSLARERVPGFYSAFWRTQAGAEVDLLLGNGRKLFPIEVKLSATLDGHAFAGIRSCMKDLGLESGWIVYGGKERRQAGDVELVPWADVAAGKVVFPFE
ncbi:MAG: ATP-binding protein [Planctomycetes bacterium]|nr:ATP-binding protein [Planctomycetota bacterium]